MRVTQRKLNRKKARTFIQEHYSSLWRNRDKNTVEDIISFWQEWSWVQCDQPIRRATVYMLSSNPSVRKAFWVIVALAPQKLEWRPKP